MGNLGRAGYGASVDGMWPYSYDTCDVGTLPNQTFVLLFSLASSPRLTFPLSTASPTVLLPPPPRPPARVTMEESSRTSSDSASQLALAPPTLLNTLVLPSARVVELPRVRPPFLSPFCSLLTTLRLQSISSKAKSPRTASKVPPLSRSKSPPSTPSTSGATTRPRPTPD